MTAVELYNERFRDLIGASFRNLGEEEASTSSSKTESDVEKPIRVADGQVTGCESVRESLSYPLTHPPTNQNQTQVLVQSPDEILHVLQHAKTQRKVSATKMNKESSRSHFIFTLNVRTRKLNEVTGEDEIKDGRLYLVDLAGSESIGKSGAKGMRATEAKKINKSNEALKRVIESLCNGWSHIPYVVFEREA